MHSVHQQVWRISLSSVTKKKTCTYQQKGRCLFNAYIPQPLWFPQILTWYSWCYGVVINQVFTDNLDAGRSKREYLLSMLPKDSHDRHSQTKPITSCHLVVVESFQSSPNACLEYALPCCLHRSFFIWSDSDFLCVCVCGFFVGFFWEGDGVNRNFILFPVWLGRGGGTEFHFVPGETCQSDPPWNLGTSPDIRGRGLLIFWASLNTWALR